MEMSMNVNLLRASVGLLAGLVAGMIVVSCGGGSSNSSSIAPAPTLTSIALSPTAVSLADGGTQQLTVNGTYSNSTTAALASSGETYASSNTAVATVSATGLVTVAANAASGSTATITATDTASGLKTAAADSTVVTVAVGPNPNSIAAAKATAANNSECKAPNITNAFYWEIGDKNGALVTGIQPSSTGTELDPEGNQITPNVSLWSIASGSKWIYASYVVEIRTAAVILAETPSSNPYDIPYLNFTSGWVYLGNYPPTSTTCTLTNSVDECISGIPGDPVTPMASAVGKFWYDSDHLEEHSSLIMGLGGDHVLDLKTPIEAELGTNLGNTNGGAQDFNYSFPELAAGVYTTSDDYAAFLRNILQGNLQMSKTLSAFPVCTNSTVAGCNAVPDESPMANASNNAEAWHYSLGHWIEDDPVVGDGSFSSAGALGFYPWIDKTSTYYGMLVREDQGAAGTGAFEGYQSAVCGRLIRQAWMSGVEQTGTAPDFSSKLR
jgi:Big-like domain-containing protein